MEDTMMMTKSKESSPCSSSALGINKESQAISKVKPKIRIIHIFAPEIIKTDVENFRELVQRLTGKPSPADQHRRIKRPSKQQEHHHQQQKESNSEDNNKKKKKAEEMVQIKEEEEMWNNSGGFLSDFDGFFQQLDHFSPNDHFHPFGETQLTSL